MLSAGIVILKLIMIYANCFERKQQINIKGKRNSFGCFKRVAIIWRTGLTDKLAILELVSYKSYINLDFE